MDSVYFEVFSGGGRGVNWCQLSVVTLGACKIKPYNRACVF